MNTGERQTALQRARRGDRQALGALLESFRPYCRALVRNLGDHRLDARVSESDLVQDAFLQVQQAFAEFRGGTLAEFVVWLRRITLRSAGHTLRAHLAAGKRDAGREEAVEDFENLAASGSSPSGHAMREEQEARIAQALARLPEDMQQVLLARHVDRQPHAEIAALLGRSEGAVRVLYTRAVRRLRELLKNQGEP